MWPKKYGDSEAIRIADWTLQSGYEDGKEPTLCIKLKLWQLVELHLKRSPFEEYNGSTPGQYDESEDDESLDEYGSEGS